MKELTAPRGNGRGRLPGFSAFRAVITAVTLLLAGTLLWYRQFQPVIHAIDGYTMGSTWSVRFVAPAQTDTAPVKAQLEQLLGELDNSLSGYRPDSALARLNMAPVGQWVAISRHLSNTLRFGVELWRESRGAFDMTVKPLVDLWGFGAAQPRDNVPADTEIEEARNRVDATRLELAPDGTRARRLSNIAIDIDGIAPGYAAGVLSEWLTSHGFPDHLVEIGGEMHASGLRPDGGGWRVAIEAPEMTRRHIERVVTVTDAAVTTAGDYRDYFEVEGTRYQHILDPITGRPVSNNLASVTVVAQGRLTADGYATAIMVLGEEKGLAFADAHQLSVFMILRAADGTFHERYNASFVPYIAQH